MLDDPWHRIFLVGLLLALATMIAAEVIDDRWKRWRNERSVCRGCGEGKKWAEFIDDGRHEYCRECGVVRCASCGEVKPTAAFAESQTGGWLCLACGSTVCRICRKKLPDKAFRDPMIDATCRDCEARHLSDHERAALEREERDYRSRVKEGHIPHTGDEWSEVYARRAALLGVSTHRYREEVSSIGWGLGLIVIYLLSTVVVGIYAIVHGCHGGALWQVAGPPELLPILVTTLALAGLLFSYASVEGTQAYQDLELRLRLTHRDSFLPLVALLLPVLTYVLVLIVAS